MSVSTQAPVQAEGRPESVAHSMRTARWLAVEHAVALAATFTAPISLFVLSGLRLGGAVALLLCPFWIPSLRRYSHGRAFILVGLVAWASGLILTEVRRGSLFVNDSNAHFQSLDLLGFLAVVGLLLWARVVLSTRTVGIVFGVAMVVSIPLNLPAASANYWKFAVALPLTVLLLSVLGGRRRSRLWPEILGLTLLLLASAKFDSRSLAAALAFAIGLVAWQKRPVTRASARWWGWSAAVLAVTGIGMYFLGTGLLVSGALGAETQQRTIRQVETSGSLLLGGRPEIMATVALMSEVPLGFGYGVQVDTTLLNDVKTSMQTINYQTADNKYVDVFMFGQAIELHSAVADLWAMCGVMGAALGLFAVVALVRGVVEGVQRRQARAVALLLAVWALFELGFGPFYSAVTGLSLALALNFSTKEPETSMHGHPLTQPRRDLKEKQYADV